jgi:hypothetical protein
VAGAELKAFNSGSLILVGILVTDDQPVEFEKYRVEVRDFRRITDHFRGIYRRIYHRKMNESERCRQHVTGWILNALGT